MESKVYFTSMKISHHESLLDRLEKLTKAAGIEQIDFQNKFVAIKIHFGEPGNLAYLRPNYARRIVSIVKSLGGKPFLTDCNTLYVGRRKNALDHLSSAFENGYNYFQTDCHTIIADGLRGTDEAEIVINKEFVKSAKIGRAIADADIIISMSHVKGHGLAGFGGALKNLGMGSGSRAGKHEMHSSGKPFIREDKCKGCMMCIKNCAAGAITMTDKKSKINPDLCVGCGRCIGVCSFDAIRVDWNESSVNLNKKIAEYAFAVVLDKPAFHINFIIDVSPDCDCDATNNVPIIANIGFLASFDPVALDKASVDLINQAPMINGYEDSKNNHFTALNPNTTWDAGLKHGEKIGLGTMNYQLIEVK
ncbi:MAG TPA: 4Fe-4S ferredoxin [Acholeplasmatales bacterium]|nr:4Fe-4S ferredoxin [Acholeplasmatales bacterium]